MHAGEMRTCQVARTLTTLKSRCTLWRVFGSMACCFLAKLVLGPPHYHDTFQTCQTWRVGVCMLARCVRVKSHAHSPHTTLWRLFGEMECCFFAKLVLGPPHYHDTFQTCQTWRVGVCMLARCARVKSHAHFSHTYRDPPCVVSLPARRSSYLPSWCLVHHTTMTPFKRARRGEWAYACWRDVHVPSRTHTHHTGVEMHLVACVWEYGVLFFCQVGVRLARLNGFMAGPPHYHDTFQTCQTWRVGVCMLARCARATRRTHTHHTRVEMHLVVCVWEYCALFFGQVGAWSTTLP